MMATMRLLRGRASTSGEDVEASVDGSASVLAAECEAFLAGRLPEVWACIDEPPVWTWLNPIAHGSAERIGTIAADPSAAVRASTVRTIAEAVLARHDDLATLQREVLVPLEVAHAGEVMTPRRLIELVALALYDVEAGRL